MNYALVGAGAFDFASDPAGYTHGAVLEWENGTWATRLGGFQVTRNQGGDQLDERIDRAWQLLGQLDPSGGRGAIRGAAAAARRVPHPLGPIRRPDPGTRRRRPGHRTLPRLPDQEHGGAEPGAAADRHGWRLRPAGLE